MDDLFVVHSISRIRFKDSSRTRWWYAAELVFIDLYIDHLRDIVSLYFAFNRSFISAPCPVNVTTWSHSFTESTKSSRWSCQSMYVLENIQSEQQSSSREINDWLNLASLLLSSVSSDRHNGLSQCRHWSSLFRHGPSTFLSHSASIPSSMNRWCVFKSMAIQRVRFRCWTARGKMHAVYDIKGIECDHSSNAQTSNMLFLLWQRSIAVESSEELP